jgi:hypothetical protein
MRDGRACAPLIPRATLAFAARFRYMRVSAGARGLASGHRRASGLAERTEGRR